MIQRIKRALGLPGSFTWAVRKMKKGHEMTRKDMNRVALRYTCDERGLIVCSTDEKANSFKHGGVYRWNPGTLAHDYVMATDWVFAKSHKPFQNRI